MYVCLFLGKGYNKTPTPALQVDSPSLQIDLTNNSGKSSFTWNQILCFPSVAHSLTFSLAISDSNKTLFVCNPGKLSKFLKLYKSIHKKSRINHGKLIMMALMREEVGVLEMWWKMTILPRIWGCCYSHGYFMQTHAIWMQTLMHF